MQSGNLIIDDFSSVFDSVDVMELKCMDGMRTSVFFVDISYDNDM